MVADKESSRDLQNLLQGRKWSGREGKEIIKPHEEMQREKFFKAITAFSYLLHYSFIFSNIICSYDLSCVVRRGSPGANMPKHTSWPKSCNILSFVLSVQSTFL